PPRARGQLVSFNQLNIVIGISAAYFSNYLILQLAESPEQWAQALGFAEFNWRWMLGLETIPAILYFFFLFFVPNSPRWLLMKKNWDEARHVMIHIMGEAEGIAEFEKIKESMMEEEQKPKSSSADLFSPAMRLVLIIGLVVGILQQITGINSVFFYAPMIFEQSGIGENASFTQAIYVGLVNLIFTVLAMSLIDRLGRKPLLAGGLIGITAFMFLLAYGFNSATYTLTEDALTTLPAEMNIAQVEPLVGQTYESDLDYKAAISHALGDDVKKYESAMITAAISIDPMLILIGILGFVASFAVSAGPVMWVLFSELFPQKIRGIAISVVGFVNSLVSFLVQFVFPWELSNLGNATTFLIYGLFAAAGFVFVAWVVPETKGKSLEELETLLIQNDDSVSRIVR
ncbi:MAG: MFS transporter, partial [Bacteroidota bacterium]